MKKSSGAREAVLPSTVKVQGTESAEKLRECSVLLVMEVKST